VGSISDNALAAGCAKHIGAVHGDQIRVLTGLDAGKYFTVNIIETEADLELSTDLGIDPRARVVMRFDNDFPIPALNGQERIRTSDGKVWTAVKAPQNSYLTTDFELKENKSGTDK